MQNDLINRAIKEQLLGTPLLAGEILDTLREAALVLSPDLCIERANQAFLTLFQMTRFEVEGRRLAELDVAWSTQTLRPLLEYHLLGRPGGELTDFELSYDLPAGIGPRILCVNARCLPGDPESHRPERIFLVIEDITEKRSNERENQRLRTDAKDAEEHRIILLRDVLASATDGKLVLCLTENDLPPRGSDCTAPFSLTLPTLRELRHSVRTATKNLGISPERVDDFENAVGEAAMNAVVHGGGGIAHICTISESNDIHPTPRVQVWISDYGKGINVHDIPRAALEKGFTTRGTMGQGFKIVLRTADRVYLLTGETGTTVVIEQDKEPPLPSWLRQLRDDAQ